MKLRINYKNLAAEFVVVVVGVAVALAADNWRQNFNDRVVEQEYLIRIKDELLIGRGQLESFSSRYHSALESTEVLIEYLEGHSDPIENHVLVEHFTRATRTGGPVPDAAINHNSVYSELVSTGRLSLISDSDLRSEMTNYFREIDGLVANLSALPLDVWTRFRELTSREAGYYYQAGEFPTGEAARRLIQEIDSDNLEFIRELRLLGSRLEFLTRSLQNRISTNLALEDLLEARIS